jgi:putative membrane protein
MKIHRSLFTVGLIASMALTATPSAYAKEITDQDFVTRATIANKFEIESSQIALKKSETSAVRHFAQRVLDDHTKAGNKLEDIIISSGSQIQSEIEMDYKHKTLLEKLNNASDREFDAQYLAFQKAAHDESVTLFEDYSKSGENEGLKEFASDTLPILNKHLDDAEQLENNR